MQDCPAHYAPEENIFYPPTRSVVFNPTLTYNDGILAASLMRAQRISYQQATQCIEQDIATLRALLKREGDRVLFGNIGTFSLGENNTLTFEVAPDYLLNLQHFGLSTFSMLPVKELSSETKQMSVTQESIAASDERLFTFTILPTHTRSCCCSRSCSLTSVADFGTFLSPARSRPSHPLSYNYHRRHQQ